MTQTAVSSPPSLAVSDARPFRFAARCLRWATGTLAAAGVAIGLFFGGVGAVFGPINDLTTAATLTLIIPATLAVRHLARGRVGGWFSALTLATALGLGIAATSLVALVAGMITLSDSFLIGGVAMLPFLAWLAALTYAALARGVLTRRVGWLSGVTLVVAIVASALSPMLPMATLVFVLGLPLLALLAAWLWAFGSDLTAQ